MTALYTRYRSQRFDALVGQDAAVRTLKNALSSDRVAHAYLFTGIRGTGKTSTARILAKAVNCLGLVDGEPDNTCVNCVAINDAAATDLIEIDAASNRGVDEIRDLREKARYLPALLKRKVYIIDEAHQLTNEAFNALLKTLEEPPEHVLFILCTTESHKLPATIISRTQRFDFRRISEEEIAARLAWISQQEALVVRPDGLALLAAMAQGSMRDGITMLDQMASAGVDAIDGATVRRQLGLVTQRELAGLLAAASRGDAATAMRELDGLASKGADMRQLTANLAEIARKAVLLSIGAADARALGIEEDAATLIADVVGEGGREFAARAFELAVGAGTEMRQAHDPRLLLELTLLKLSTGAAVLPRAAVPALPVADRASPGPPTAPHAEARSTAAQEPGAAPPPVAAPASRSLTAASPAPIPAELAEVRSRWPVLLENLRGSAPATRLRALLNDASPLAVDDDLLTIGFRFAMLSEKAQEPLHRAELEKALSHVYGRTFRLSFQVTPDQPPATAMGNPPLRAAPAPAAVATSAPGDSDRDRGDARPPEADPRASAPAGTVSGEELVEAAVELLGARVTDIRSRQRPP